MMWRRGRHACNLGKENREVLGLGHVESPDTSVDIVQKAIAPAISALRVVRREEPLDTLQGNNMQGERFLEVSNVLRNKNVLASGTGRVCGRANHRRP